MAEQHKPGGIPLTLNLETDPRLESLDSLGHQEPVPASLWVCFSSCKVGAIIALPWGTCPRHTACSLGKQGVLEMRKLRFRAVRSFLG